MYNLENIKEDLSCIEAAEALGIKIKKRGKENSILCPVHNDRHFGSCFVSDKRWNCYACGAGGDVFSLIEAVTGCSKKESFEEAAKLTGRADSYKKDSNEDIILRKKKDEFPLTSEELSLIGLEKSYTVKNVKNISFNENESTSLKKIDLEYDDENHVSYYLYGTKEKQTIYDLFDEDKESVKYIIALKTMELQVKIEALLSCNFSQFLPLKPEDVYAIQNIYKMDLIKCDTILKKIQNA